jgi:hypothetical protein
MRGRVLVGVLAPLAVVLALALSPGSLASTPSPMKESKGVRLVKRQGVIVVVFTDRAAGLYRRIAGKRIVIGCTDLPEPDELSGVSNMDEGTLHFTAPKRRQSLPTFTRVASHDYCRVWLASRAGRNGNPGTKRRLVVSVPLTQVGVVFLDEQVKTRRLLSILQIAGLRGDAYDPPRYPATSELIDSFSPFGLAWLRAVALASPSDSPPPGRYGYYSDGQRRVAVVALSAAGRRLFIEYDAEGALHTNVADYLEGDASWLADE